jgi:MFS family permease
MAPDRVSLGRLWALMGLVFTDMVGFLIILPVMPFYADRLGASAFLIGAMVSTYAVASLAMAPLWGRFSDRHGRRPALMLGVVIAMVAHLLFAFACSNFAMGILEKEALIGLLFLSRLVQGAGGATTSVVQAYVGDAIVPEERAKALGWITAATSAGVMLGPALGSMVTLLGPSAPGLVSAGLCVVNLAFAWRWLPESHHERAHKDAPRPSLRKKFWAIATEPTTPVARLVWIYAIGMMAFMAMNAILALFLQARFGITEKTFGYVYAYVGTISLVMRSLILGPTVRRFGEIRVLRLGLLALALGFALQPLAPNVWVYIVVVLFIPVGTALLFPATTSLVTRFASRQDLGATMGVQQAFGGVARFLGPLWAGAAFESLGSGSPLWISSGLALATLFLFANGLSAADHAPAPPEPQAAG